MAEGPDEEKDSVPCSKDISLSFPMYEEGSKDDQLTKDFDELWNENFGLKYRMKKLESKLNRFSLDRDVRKDLRRRYAHKYRTIPKGTVEQPYPPRREIDPVGETKIVKSPTELEVAKKQIQRLKSTIKLMDTSSKMKDTVVKALQEDLKFLSDEKTKDLWFFLKIAIEAAKTNDIDRVVFSVYEIQGYLSEMMSMSCDGVFRNCVSEEWLSNVKKEIAQKESQLKMNSCRIYLAGCISAICIIVLINTFIIL